MARQFKVGDTVKCPADRGSPGYIGQVTHVSADQNTNIHGTPYYWVTVKQADGKRSEVWPSHRIELLTSSSNG